MEHLQSHFDEILNQNIQGSEISSILIHGLRRTLGADAAERRGDLSQAESIEASVRRDMELRDAMEGTRFALADLLNGSAQISVDPLTKSESITDYVGSLVGAAIKQYLTEHPDVVDTLYDEAVKAQNPELSYDVSFTRDPRVSAVYWYLCDAMTDAKYDERIAAKFVHSDRL